MEQSIKIDELLLQIDEVKKKLHSEGNSSNVLNSYEKHPAPIVTPKEVFEPTESYKSSQHSQPSESLQSTSVPVPKQRIIAQENQPRYTFVTPVKKEAEEQKPEVQTSPHNSKISFSEIQQQWNTIVDEMRKKKISVGTILGETSPLDLVNGTLRIACGDDFHQGTLLRNKEILSETINTIVNARLRIEPILHDGGLLRKEKQTTLDSTLSSPEISLPNTAPSNSKEEHPLIKKLYSDFGVERV